MNMATDLEIHKIQSNILVALLLSPSARFSQLNKLNVPTDQFNFHIKSLVTAGLIIKDKEGLYNLTDKGKEFANRFDTDQKAIEKQAKIAVLICCLRTKNGEKEYLLQQRLKQPYYGYWGFISGKVRWGESIYETAKREFKEETGLEADFKLVGVKHKSDYDKVDKLLEDKFFFVMRGENARGTLKSKFEAGKNKWITKDKIFKLKELFDDVDRTLTMASGNELIFAELKFNVNKY